MNFDDLFSSGECSICGEKNRIKYLPIFITGSEGIHVCPSCDLALAQFASHLRGVSIRSKKAFKIGQKKE